jgi:broad-specificity NMP kinase
VFAVIVTGPPGAGKTVCLMALADALVVDEIAHAAIDADEVSWSFPYPDTPRRGELVAALWEAHRGDGHELLLIAEVIESDEHLAELLEGVGAGDHLLVRLEARPETLRERILAREPAGWSGLEYLLGEMERWAVSLTELGGVHVTLDSESLSPEEIAARIRSERPEKLGG